MNTRSYIRQNITSVSILIFTIIFIVIQFAEPNFLYNKGKLRQFGIGTKQKTILPIWLLSMILAIFSYLFVMYYLTYPKFY
jgi:hypothetical protein